MIDLVLTDNKPVRKIYKHDEGVDKYGSDK